MYVCSGIQRSDMWSVCIREIVRHVDFTQSSSFQVNLAFKKGKAILVVFYFKKLHYTYDEKIHLLCHSY